MTGWAALALAMTGLAACSSYPSEPRYSIYADQRAAPAGPPPPGAYGPPVSTAPSPSEMRVAAEDGAIIPPATVPDSSPPPARAPTEDIQGGALDAPANATAPVPTPEPAPAAPAAESSAAATPATSAPATSAPASSTPASPAPATPRAPAAATGGTVHYVIQPGDTISGVGRRFQTPVQTLVDLNSLGPRAAISAGQRIRLPETAVDRGPESHASGPSPIGVVVAENGTPPPPPPPPPSGNRPMPPREPAATARPPAATDGSLRLAWPVRGEILRRFGPVGLGERNNGVNIAGAAGAEVRASAAGTVGYVGDDIGGQGLTVLIAHEGGWRTVYSHLGRASVRDGQRVEAGQVIGTVGTTAGDGQPSIHFETWRVRGDTPSAVDPLTVLPR